MLNQFNLFLEILVITSIICSLTVITSTNPIIAIIYLICVFLIAAIYLILIGLGFIGISYIIVYIGAITVLFLFVIMMINTDILDIVEIGPEYGKNIPLAYTISLLFITFFILFLPFIFFNNLGVEDTNSINYFSLNADLEIVQIFNYVAHQINSFLNFNTNSLNSYYENIEINNFSLVNNTNLFNPELLISNALQIETLGVTIYSNVAIVLILSSLILLLALIAPIILSRRTVNISNAN